MLVRQFVSSKVLCYLNDMYTCKETITWQTGPDWTETKNIKSLDFNDELIQYQLKLVCNGLVIKFVQNMIELDRLAIHLTKSLNKIKGVDLVEQSTTWVVNERTQPTWYLILGDTSIIYEK